MKRIIGIIAIAGLCLAPAARAQHTGRVFVDSNENNRFDRGEKLLDGVSVSDGLNVVQTASDGSFTLPGQPKERFIFITTPSGYKTDNAYYKRIEGGQVEYDFALRPVPVKRDGSHKFIHISDMEIGEAEGHEDWISGLRDYASNEEVAFVMHTGDICYRPGLNSHIRLMNTKNFVQTQVFYGIGNHDLVSGKYGEELFEELYGPTFYSFEVGNVHYVVTPMLGGDYQPSYRKKNVCEWLKNDLQHVSPGKAVVCFNHSIPDDTENLVYAAEGAEPVDLVAHNLKGWFYGHWHVNHIHTNAVNGVRLVCTSTPIRGGIDHAPSAFRVLSVDGKGDFTSAFRYSYIDKSLCIASPATNQVPLLSSGNVPLSVNVYSTVSPVSTVSYTCYHEGERVAAPKPLKQQTDFNWNAEISLPESMNGLTVTVDVEARFANGEVARKAQSFVYAKDRKPEIRMGQDWATLLASPQHVVPYNPDTLQLPLRLAWVQNVGTNIFMSSPLLYNGSVFVASIDDNETGKAVIAAMDAVTGTVRWRYPVGASVRNSMAIEGGILFAQDVHGLLYALNAGTGQLVWKKDLGLSLVPALNDGLTATNGVVYAGTGKSLCALKATDGTLLWQNKDWNRGEGCTATLSLDQNVLIGHAHWGALYGNDATTGKMLWRLEDGQIRHRSSSAAMRDGLLYLVSSESFYIIESATGRVVVRKELGYNVNVTSTPLVTDSEIIFGTADRGVVALDRETLEEKWNFRTDPALIYTAPYVRNPASTVETSPVLAGNTLFIGASDGNLYALNPKDGKRVWSYAMGAPIFTTAAISGNGLYVADYAGNVYCFVPSGNH